MNKETIYIEPSDDITDILTKLKSSDKKIVALVPPKKPTVLLSSVNIKLIARAAKTEKKAVVVISTDDSLTKLAMAANLPVAPSLKSRPVMPEGNPEISRSSDSEEQSSPEEDDAEKEEKEEESDPEISDSQSETGEDEDDEESDDDETKEDKADKSEKKSKQKEKKKKEKKQKDDYSNAFIAFVAMHKALVIAGIFVLVGVAGFLFWAFTIAPRVSVAVSVRTSSANFSENVVFVTQPADEDSKTGKFYLREEKLEKDQVVKFTATGKKDIGTAASGEIAVIAYFSGPGSLEIPANAKFTHGGFDYLAVETKTLVGPKNGSYSAIKDVCDNASEDLDINITPCQVSAVLAVQAAAPGEDYNLSATNDGWSSSVPGLGVIGKTDITGGTSKIVTVVQQSDVDIALDKMKSESSGDGKNELYVKLSDTVMSIEASYKVSTTDPKVSPAVGEEVGEGVTPQISTKTTYSVFTVDKVRIEEFIKAKANVEEGKRLYSIGDPFIEYFSEGSDNTYNAKLKTMYKIGAEISETEVLDKIRGEKIGRIEPILKDSFPGIASVKIEKSYFWVNAVPKDANKVKIELTVEE